MGALGKALWRKILRGTIHHRHRPPDVRSPRPPPPSAFVDWPKPDSRSPESMPLCLVRSPADLHLARQVCMDQFLDGAGQGEAVERALRFQFSVGLLRYLLHALRVAAAITQWLGRALTIFLIPGDRWLGELDHHSLGCFKSRPCDSPASWLRTDRARPAMNCFRSLAGIKSGNGTG
jgi:hypothetical protein